MKITTRRDALIYGRVSTLLQDGEDKHSLLEQEKACRKKAKENGYRVIEAYNEIGSGGSLFERKKMTECRDRIRAGEIDALVVYAVDRLSRRVAHAAIIADECERAGVELLFVTDEYDESGQGQLMMSIKAYVAEVEREKIRHRTQGGRRARLESGKLMKSGLPLYAYVINQKEGKREVVDREAATVQRIFDWYVNDRLSIRAIADRLAHDEIPTPAAGKRSHAHDYFVIQHEVDCCWAPSTIHRILKNPAYIGVTFAYQYQEVESKKNGQKRTLKKRRPEDQWIKLPDDTTPAIVSEELFAGAQKRLASNVGHETRNAHRQALLRGMVYCECGQKMYPAWTRPSPSKSKKDYVYFGYKCTARKSVCGISGSQVNGNKIEAAVWAKMCDLFRDKNVIKKELLERQNTSAADTARVRENAAAATARLKKIETEIERLVERIGQLDDSLFEMVKKQIDGKTKEMGQVQEMIDDLTQELALHSKGSKRLKELDDLCGEEVAKRMESMTFEQKREFVSVFITRIIANRRSVKLKVVIDPSKSVALNLNKNGAKNLTSSVSSLSGHETQLQNQPLTFTMTLAL